MLIAPNNERRLNADASVCATVIDEGLFMLGKLLEESSLWQSLAHDLPIDENRG